MTLKQAIHHAAQNVAHTTLTVAVYRDCEGYFWKEFADGNSWIEGAEEICRLTGYADKSMTIRTAEISLRQQAGLE